MSAPAAAPPVVRRRKPKIRWGLGHFWLAVGMTLLTSFGSAFVAIGYVIATGGASWADPLALTDATIDAALSPPGLLFFSVVQYGTWLAAVQIASRFGMKSWAKDFWLRLSQPWWRDVALGAGVAAVIIVAQVAIDAALAAAGMTVDNTSVFTQAAGTLWVIPMFILIAIVGPFTEEMLFRGLLLQSLIRWYGRPKRQRRARARRRTSAWVVKHRATLAIIVSSIIFGIPHATFDGNSLSVIAITGLMGAALAVLTVRTGRLAPAIVAHMLINATAFSLAMAA